ncbi:MAG: hypothetical protein EHM13_05175, partial [Acidobacteria bacterium]
MPRTLHAKLSLLLPSLVLLLLVLPKPVWAQTTNPTKVEFTASADHSALLGDGRPVVEKYVLNVYQVGAQAPFHTIDLGKPTPDGANTIVSDFSATLPGWPLPGGTYESRVAALGPTGQSLSDVSNTFVFDSCPTPPTCTSFTIAPSSASPGAGAGSQVVTIAGVPAGCAGGVWTAAGNGFWITVLPVSGNGPGTATVSWTANTATSSRSGNATIAGNTFGVTQAGVPPPPTCTSFSITPTSVTPTAAAGTQLVTITGAPAGCAGGSWAASGNGSWLSVYPMSGTGPGGVTVSWTGNTSTSSRTGSATVAGHSFAVTQAGTAVPTCTSFSISPTSASSDAGAGSRVVTVTGAPSGCTGGTWTAAGNGSWITVSPANGTGSGSATVSWTANTSPSARLGYATIAGNSFPVNQTGVAPVACTSFTIAPTSASPGAPAGSQVVTLTGVPAGC